MVTTAPIKGSRICEASCERTGDIRWSSSTRSAAHKKKSRLLGDARGHGEGNEHRNGRREPLGSPGMEKSCGSNCGSGEQLPQPRGAIRRGRRGEWKRGSWDFYRSKRRAKWASHLTAIKRRDSRAGWTRGWSEVEDGSTWRVGPTGQRERKEKKRKKGVRGRWAAQMGWPRLL